MLANKKRVELTLLQGNKSKKGQEIIFRNNTNAVIQFLIDQKITPDELINEFDVSIHKPEFMANTIFRAVEGKCSCGVVWGSLPEIKTNINSKEMINKFISIAKTGNFYLKLTRR